MPRLATLEARAQRILTARTLAEKIVFRSKTAGFHSKFDHCLVKIERGTGGGVPARKEIFERGGDEAAMEYFRKKEEYFHRVFFSKPCARNQAAGWCHREQVAPLA